MKVRNLLLLLFICTMAQPLLAQEALKPKPSPLDMRTYKFANDTYLKVIYSRPHKRGREVFGELVPFGKVWRTGANQATEITVTQPVWFEGHELPAGTYALFTIPEDGQWTVILNRDLGQWGSFNYREEADVLRVTVPTSATEEEYEPFTIDFEQQENSVVMVLIWDQTKVSLEIKPQE